MTTKWGIASAGKICHDFVTAVRSLPEGEHEIVSVAARNLQSASEFATLHKIPNSYGSYEELANDPNVEVVYIGSISSQHFLLGKLMLEAKKHVLMEKPMTLNAKQTYQLSEIARKNNRFLMEAIWSRFVPSYKYMMSVIESGEIGKVVHVGVTFGFDLKDVERLTKRSLGGGSLLDLGIYTLNLASMAFGGAKPKKIAAVGHLNKDGVDTVVNASLLYENGSANISTSMLADLPSEAVITGTKGVIRIPKPFWCATQLVTPQRTYDFPLPETVLPCNFMHSSGLRYEAEEVRKCLKNGLLESPILPLKDSEALAEMMDEIRKQIGVVYDAD